MDSDFLRKSTKKNSTHKFIVDYFGKLDYKGLNFDNLISEKLSEVKDYKKHLNELSGRTLKIDQNAKSGVIKKYFNFGRSTKAKNTILKKTFKIDLSPFKQSNTDGNNRSFVSDKLNKTNGNVVTVGVGDKPVLNPRLSRLKLSPIKKRFGLVNNEGISLSDRRMDDIISDYKATNFDINLGRVNSEYNLKSNPYINIKEQTKDNENDAISTITESSNAELQLIDEDEKQASTKMFSDRVVSYSLLNKNSSERLISSKVRIKGSAIKRPGDSLPPLKDFNEMCRVRQQKILKENKKIKKKGYKRKFSIVKNPFKKKELENLIPSNLNKVTYIYGNKNSGCRSGGYFLSENKEYVTNKLIFMPNISYNMLAKNKDFLKDKFVKMDPDRYGDYEDDNEKTQQENKLHNYIENMLIRSEEAYAKTKAKVRNLESKYIT